MAESLDKFCTICDPAPVKAVEWCSECEDFLCSECIKYHKGSKSFKTHCTTTVDNYNELPEVVKNFKFHCEEHEEKLESYCPTHSCPCCMRCALSTHKVCRGVAPMRDFTINCKSSSSITDIDQTLRELTSYVGQVIEYKRKNKQEITDQKKKIREEIIVFRKLVNDHLDRLEQELFKELDSKVESICTDIDSIVNEFTESRDRVESISKDYNKLKEHGTDQQTFLCMPSILSSVSDEEKNVRKWKDDKKLNIKQLKLDMKLEDYVKIKSIGELHVKDISSDLEYTPQKEKQAQIMNVSTSRQLITLKLKQRFKANVLNNFSSISGCCLVGHGNILCAEYNRQSFVDRVTLHDVDGNFVRVVLDVTQLRTSIYDVTTTQLNASIYDVTTIDDTKVAATVGNSIHIDDLLGQKKLDIIGLKGACSGITFYKSNLFFCQVSEHAVGILKYNLKTSEIELIFKVEIGEFSYVSCKDDHLYFTNYTDKVYCVDLTNRILYWQFEDTKLLCRARGIIVDNRGRIIVAGAGSNNLVEISADGKHSREILKIPNPTAICYNQDKLIVCTSANDVYIYEMHDN